MKIKRAAKHEGKGNIVIEEIDMPEHGKDEVLVKVKKSLISRGSELFARYVMPGPVDPQRMGYSDAGVIAAVGHDVVDMLVGDRVVAVAPHAEYVIRRPNIPDAWIIPFSDDISFEEATFIPLLTSSLAWVKTACVKAGDTIVVLGQGLVGNLVMQVAKCYNPSKLIAVDALQLRCDLSRKLGANVVINCSREDPVKAVKDLTDGRGADIVFECVGGDAGIKSFEQAQDMLKARGTLHLISLYQKKPLPLHSGKIMNKKLLAGILISEPRPLMAQQAVKHLQKCRVNVKEMITHRFSITEAKKAFDFLYNNPGDALGVIFDYD
ncbi:zinc-binding dehydrogenase [Candidatus Poribacteria bacterium]|nr:zinc-binding dehydrogenase [Candidatus Poribacteria bacterium]